MKTILSLALVITMAFPSLTQEDDRCNHKTVFGKSAFSDTLDVIHYNLFLDVLDFTGKTITGSAELQVESKVNNLGFLKLELLDLTVDAVKVNGTNHSFTHQGYIIEITLQAPLNTGQTAMVEVDYHGQPFHEDWGGFHWSGEYAFNLGVGFVSIPHNLGKTWFPCIDDFHDMATYDLYVTTQDNKMAVCGGTLVNSVNNGNGTITWHWSLANAIPTYLASVAVGDYAAVTDVYNGISGDVPIEIYVRPQDSIKVPGSFLHLKEITAIFEDKFGPYPFERIGYVGTAIGAMEHATNIAYPNFCIDNSTTYESLYAHELSHMWFGDNVTCANAGEMWINEGWAVFCEAIYREFLYNRQQYDDFIRDKHADVLQLCHTSGGDGSYFPLNQIPETVTYGMSAYDKGATVAHSLRGYIGDDIFFDAMTAFNEHFKFSYASSYDFRDFLTGHTGIDMTGFFDSWVLHSGTPHFSVDSFLVSPEAKTYNVQVFMRQKRKGPAFTGNSNIVELTFMDNNWNTFTDTVHFSGATGSSVIEAPFAPDIVLCDAHALLCDATTDYSHVIKEAGNYDYHETFFDLIADAVGDSAFVRVEHNWVPPDPPASPVQGLTISNYRYWKVDGIFPQDFSATGKFWYNKNGFLDDSLLVNEEDSVVILYRTGPGKNWQFIDFEKVGIWSIGNLFVELQKGEYVIGVCDDTFVGESEKTAASEKAVLFFPNPTGGAVYIQNLTGKNLFIDFYEVSGALVGQLKLSKESRNLQWEPAAGSSGAYFARITDENNDTLEIEKIMFIRE
ncbi:MAG: M1 family metallopeptidase [Bacteroidales bacterium]|nr:M1 family metallopeptidase [Bacteroidales bacterium]